MSFDGSNWDAHQHYTVIEAVQFPFIKIVLEKFLLKFDLYLYSEAISDILLARTAKFFMMY